MLTKQLMITDLLQLLSKLSGLSFVAGFLLLAHAHNRQNYIKNLLKNGTKTEGKVVELFKNPGPIFSKEEGVGFAPVVEYTNSSGNVVKHYSRTYRLPAKYEVGQVLPIWYINYKSIREATLEDDLPGDLPKKLFFVGIILLLLSLPALLPGLKNFF